MSMIGVVIPCQHLDEEGCPCEDDVNAIVEATPAERQTWDYPGSGEEWEVVSMELCRKGHIRLSTEYKEMADWAIGQAKQLVEDR